MSLSPAALHWFLNQRGISKETLTAFNITEVGGALCFPYPGGANKYRRGFEKEDRSFWWDPADKAGSLPFLVPEFDKREIMFLCEGETDTLTLWQSAPPELKSGIVGISGLSAWKDSFTNLFEEARYVYCLFDNDDPYGQAAKHNEQAWTKLKKALGDKARRVILPQGIKDVSEFFLHYDWEAFRILVKAASQHRWNYEALDLTGPIPIWDWLVDPLLLKGEVIALVGDGGLGKSWLTLDLAVALAMGRTEWLGLPLAEEGETLYIDQENPLVGVRNRMKKLGLSESGSKRIRYLWQAGVRLDSEEGAQRLLEDAAALKPRLIVLDSFSTLHRKNENSAEDVNPIFHGGILPLARETNATVLLIHHTNKSGGTRGSSAINNACDNVLELRHMFDSTGRPTGKQLLVPSKLRNIPPFGSTFIIERRNGPEGSVELRRVIQEDAF